jgi:hypothetical protein
MLSVPGGIQLFYEGVSMPEPCWKHGGGSNGEEDFGREEQKDKNRIMPSKAKAKARKPDISESMMDNVGEGKGDDKDDGKGKDHGKGTKDPAEVVARCLKSLKWQHDFFIFRHEIRGEYKKCFEDASVRQQTVMFKQWRKDHR